MTRSPIDGLESRPGRSSCRRRFGRYHLDHQAVVGFVEFLRAIEVVDADPDQGGVQDFPFGNLEPAGEVETKCASAVQLFLFVLAYDAGRDGTGELAAVGRVRLAVPQAETLGTPVTRGRMGGQSQCPQKVLGKSDTHYRRTPCFQNVRPGCTK